MEEVLVVKKKKSADPFAEREAEKYEKPIPSREFILDLLEKRGSPAKRNQLLEELDLEDDQQQEALRRRLRAMERDGQLVVNRRGAYGVAKKMNLVTGRVIGHHDGFGFLVPDDGGDDLFLNAREMKALFDGDRAIVRVMSIDRRGRREASVVEVLARKHQHIVGRFFLEDGLSYVVPDNKRISQTIIIPATEQALAKSGQIVVTEIITPPSKHHQATGRISEVLGDYLAPGMEIDVAVRVHDLPRTWSDAVLAEVDQLTEIVADKDKQNRVDLTHLPLVTIDGEDAKDFDDAVYCTTKPKGGWILYVAIADVSHYVQSTAALDAAALERGNSVYFPGYVIPMLPEILSNGLCSLKPHVDRLCMVAELHINSKGELSKSQFYPAIMHSQARLTYTEVSALLERQDKTVQARYPKLVPHLQELYQLYQVLRQAREARGAIDFETTETRIIFGADRKIEAIVPVQRNEAHKLIEECMLLANVATAKFLAKAHCPLLYRVHAGPNPEKLTDLRSFLAELGLSIGGGDKPQPSDYTKLLETIKIRSDAHLIQTVLLRSLSQAVYSPENLGHFGLAYAAYTHFTSPIRRYPDLLTHRAIRHVLSGKPATEFPYDSARMVSLGEHCSQTERRADEATRDAVDMLKCEYMLDRVGESFAGIVTAVTSFGLFVELQGIFVEGLVHVTALKNDYYHFDPVKHRLRGERTGMTYRLGDAIEVKVTQVKLETKQIDFELAVGTSATKHKNAATKRPPRLPKPTKKPRKKVKKGTRK